jgi:hypothetical protein
MCHLQSCFCHVSSCKYYRISVQKLWFTASHCGANFWWKILCIKANARIHFTLEQTWHSSTEMTVCFFNSFSISLGVLHSLKQNLMHMHTQFCKICDFLKKHTPQRALHSHTPQGVTSQVRKLELWNQQQMTPQTPLYLHLPSKFYTNCSSVSLHPIQKLSDNTLYVRLL